MPPSSRRPRSPSTRPPSHSHSSIEGREVSSPTRRRAIWAIALIGCAGLAIGGAVWSVRSGNRSTTPRLRFELVASFHHDPGAFTQGLAADGPHLLEGTGRHGTSELRRVEIETGDVLERRPLPDEFFGEGIAIVGDRIIQLTWKRGTAFLYDRKTLEPIERITYDGQGWGITYDGKHLITSDGTSTLSFRNAATLKVERTIKVEDGGFPISQLNELEYIRDRIWANVWYRDEIAVIRPSTGAVEAWVDLSSVRPTSDREAVLNGIAYDQASGRIFVTGKNWPKLFEIKVTFP
ncbi:MAG TPA: glutaminyl-peptide cyclotransferase [Planctomycetaceae bacterium]|nr:glutaminyl-peptide cyclotransferase [Planctomycetaceae bacterium]